MRMYKTKTWRNLRFPLAVVAKKKIRIFSLGPAASETAGSVGFSLFSSRIAESN